MEEDVAAKLRPLSVIGKGVMSFSWKVSVFCVLHKRKVSVYSGLDFRPDFSYPFNEGREP